VGYLHIENLYKNQAILMLKECWALEKIHGTSAHIRWKDGQLTFFAGGEKHERFVALFDQPALAAAFAGDGMGHQDVTVYGEAYGGKQQGMGDTYGKELRFVVFDVKVGETWLAVPDAANVAAKLGLQFVWYTRTTTDISALDALRDRPSEQAVRNGVTDEPKRAEGVVIRPIVELFTSDGSRIIAKHKRQDFRETLTPREVDASKLAVLQNAEAIAMEWVTPMRMDHVLQRIKASDVKDTGRVIAAMLEDIEREGAGEIEWSSGAKRAVSTAAAKMYKARVMMVRA
jgi:hypothetical protein